MTHYFYRLLKKIRQVSLATVTFLIAEIWVPSIVSAGKKFLRLKNLESGASVAFFPYKTPACQIQHRMLAEVLTSRGARASLISGPLNFQSFEYPNDTAGSETLENFGQLSDKFLEIAGGDAVVARGALDEYLKNCPVDYFFSRFCFPPNADEVIQKSLAFAEASMENHLSVVVPDGAYLLNRSLISAAYRQKKRAYVFNPDGDWLEVAPGKNENHPYFSSRETKKGDHAEIARNTSRYLKRRFLGKSDDFDSAEAFSRLEPDTNLERRKVLFLHVTRDANQVPITPGERGYSVFSSFFEWAEFCLNEIASNQAEWFIKLHPSAKFYDGELEIQSRLLAKYGIAADLVEGCPTTKEVLINKMPVYTHSGSIALESAVFGYKSNIASTILPSDMAVVASTRADLQARLRLPLDNPPEPVAKEVSERAGNALSAFFQPTEPLLVPFPRQPNRTSQRKYVLSLFGQAISLAAKILTPATFRRLNSLADEIAIDNSPRARRNLAFPDSQESFRGGTAQEEQ